MQVQIKQKLTYKVQSDDTLNSICQKLKVQESELLELNQITQIRENQILLLPKSYSKIYVVKPLDTYSKIAQELGVSEEFLRQKLKGQTMFIGKRIVM